MTIYIAMQAMMQVGLSVIALVEVAKTVRFFEMQELLTSSKRHPWIELAGKPNIAPLPTLHSRELLVECCYGRAKIGKI